MTFLFNIPLFFNPLWRYILRYLTYWLSFQYVLVHLWIVFFNSVLNFCLGILTLFNFYYSLPLCYLSILLSSYVLILFIFHCERSFQLAFSVSVLQTGLLPYQYWCTCNGWIWGRFHLLLGSGRCICGVKFPSSFFSGKGCLFPFLLSGFC